jgi:DNA-binding Xre family transcriptional regulator
MNSIKRLERMLVRGKISKDEYLEAIGLYEKSRRVTVKTAEEIIAYLEAEMSEAIELHDAATDKAQRLSLMLKAYTISELLDEIKA